MKLQISVTILGGVICVISKTICKILRPTDG